MTTPTRLTTDQINGVYVAITMGFTLSEFLARKPDWPVDKVTEFWNRLEAEIGATTLKPGQYWGVPSEWS